MTNNTIQIPMDMPGAFREYASGQAQPDLVYRVQGDMRELIALLSRKKPNWQFIAQGYGAMGPAGARFYETFDVRESGQQLGVISREYTREASRHVYYVTNARMDKALKKKRGRHTGDVNKAARFALESFYAQTPAEVLGGVAGEYEGAVANALAAASSARYQAEHRIKMELFDHMLANWEELARHIPASAGYHELAAHRDEMKALHEGPRALVYTPAADVYYVRQGTNVVALSGSSIPDDLRAKVGMLKMLEVGDKVPGVGMRTGLATFGVQWEADREN